MVFNMSSFRERFGKLTVAQAIEMNNVAQEYQKLCSWSPDYEYEIRKTNDPDGKKWEEMLMTLYEWANKERRK